MQYYFLKKSPKTTTKKATTAARITIREVKKKHIEDSKRIIIWLAKSEKIKRAIILWETAEKQQTNF